MPFTMTCLEVVSSVVYGATLVFLYTISTLLPQPARPPGRHPAPATELLRHLPSRSRGSYTPFALGTLLRGPRAGRCSG
ncbi:hypothetical protein ACU4GD_13640 [Cupriavidus basilensis]